MSWEKEETETSATGLQKKTKMSMNGGNGRATEKPKQGANIKAI